MNELIQQRLSALEEEYGFKILYACESGSRAWGFASADSDYDVRFIFAWPLEKYVGIFDPKDQLTWPIDENDLDFSGWDFRKALGLFRKSNGSLMEWLFSPIVYQQDTDVMNRWRELATECFVPRNSAAHYLGLCRQMWLSVKEGKTSLTAKRYLYTLRSLLAGRFVIEKQKPVPVAFSELRSELDIPSNVSEAIDQMIVEKSSGSESDHLEPVAVLDSFIESERARLDPMISDISGDIADVELLDRFFQETLGFVKS